ncbi:helix-turn-helix transcriptional regulator [Archaeoglobus sulfaticallidus]|nr:winged helix-turn-helix transcriptional regulator [Archaeoglobus sulfaticallidus]
MHGTLRLLILIVSLLVIPVADASVIHGKIFSWENFKPLDGAVVEINTKPVQKKVTENGSYIFESILPGNYTIKAYYWQDGELLYWEENITIVSEGKYVLDMVLFPKLESPDVSGLDKVEFSLGKDEEVDQSYLAVVAVVVVVTVTAVAYFWKTRLRKTEKIEEVEMEDIDLPDDLKEVLNILMKEGGRITQKELRKKLGYSEAKVSLMIADLERRGIVEKIKKGRGNIIFLRDEFLRK